MALLERNQDPTPRQVRQFALAWFPAFCALAAGWSIYRHGSWTVAAFFVLAGLASLALGCWRPGVMRAVFIGWLAVTYPPGWLIAHGLMFVVYFLVIMPIGVVQQIAGRDPLARRFDRDAASYWVRREPPRDITSYFRPF